MTYKLGLYPNTHREGVTGTGRDPKMIQPSSSQHVMGKGPLSVANEAVAELELGFISPDEQLLHSHADSMPQFQL